jgi:hypothetical protein
MGDDVPDKKVVKKMLQSVSENLVKVAISMETLLDLDTLSIKEAACHFQAVENRKKKKQSPAVKESSGQLLLTEEQWKAWCKATSGEKFGGCGNGNGENGGGGGHSHGCAHYRGRGQSRSNSRETREEGGDSDGPSEKCCFWCLKSGHFARECRSKKKVGQANLAQGEESALMLVEWGNV